MTLRSLMGALVFWLALCPGCAEDGPALFVDVKTDFVPGHEFAEVRVALALGDDVSRAETVSLTATTSADFIGGVRAAEFELPTSGTFTIETTLHDAVGATVVSRTTRVVVDADTGVTILLSRLCVGVTCPNDGDDPLATACLAGVCAPPECTPETPGSCPDSTCIADTDCIASTECSTARCVDGICLQQSTADFCPETGYCDPDRGCEPVAGVSPTAYRITVAELVDPHFYGLLCGDATNLANSVYQDAHDDYSANFVIVFRPFDPSAASNVVDFISGADCADLGGTVSCTQGGGTVYRTVARNDGTCFTADPAVLGGYASPVPNEPSVPCFTTDRGPLAFFVDAPLESGTFAATYDATGDRLVTGIGGGFLTEELARMTPWVTGDLFGGLAAGGAPGSNCNSRQNDLDCLDGTAPDCSDGTSGFWFYQNFEADTVEWVED